MTVQELIAFLKKCHPDAVIIGNDCEIDTVYETITHILNGHKETKVEVHLE